MSARSFTLKVREHTYVDPALDRVLAPVTTRLALPADLAMIRDALDMLSPDDPDEEARRRSLVNFFSAALRGHEEGAA